MTAPFTAAEFGRIADALSPGRIDLNRTIADAKDALRYAATLAGEFERTKEDAARLKHLQDDPKRAQAYFWNYQGRKDRNAAIDADIVTAALKDRT